MNKVIVYGRLGKKPELRYTQSQKANASFSVAVTTYGKGEDGQRKEFTEWINIKCWNKLAENCEKYLDKGSLALVEGSIKTDSWEKDGDKKSFTYVLANDVKFCSPKGKDGGKAEEKPRGFDSEGQDSDFEIPF